MEFIYSAALESTVNTNHLKCMRKSTPLKHGVLIHVDKHFPKITLSCELQCW